MTGRGREFGRLGRPGERAKAPAGECGDKDQVSRTRAHPDGQDAERMDLSFTGRGVQVTEDIRLTAERKLAPLERLEPRTTRIDLELINEHHPSFEGVKRVEAALHIPRKTFRAHAEADDVPTAIDRVKDKLERQLRDHHGRRRPPKKRALESPLTQPEVEPSTGSEEQP